MRRFIALSALMMFASGAHAQDTTVVVVRHIAPAQDTTVVVRHLTVMPDTAAASARRLPPRRLMAPPGPPYGTRYAAPRATGVIAKDPYMGAMLSTLFPGGGQYYAENAGKGFLITALAIGAPIIGFNNVNRDRTQLFYPALCPNSANPGSCNPGPQYRDRTDWTPYAIGLTVGIGSWLYGIATAGTDVAAWNKAHGVRFITYPGRAGFAVALP